jgi:gliding motility-associated lipoprotein GldB
VIPFSSRFKLVNLYKIKVFKRIEESQMKRLPLFFYYFQKSLLFVAVFIFYSGCQNGVENEAKIESLPISISFDRFDLQFYNQEPEVIPDLKKKYPYLFPKQFSDSVWIARQKDSLQLILQNAVKEVFEDITPLEHELTHLFKHINYHFPQTKIPQLVTLTNNVDYQIKTVYSDSLVLLSLDTFLGADHQLYEGIPSYIRKELDQKFIASQLVEKFGVYEIPPVEDRTFLAQMLYEGKKMYLQDLLLPHELETTKIAYTEEELNWVKENELYIWQYFVERQVLYKTDPEWVQRFLEPAPFSKFYLQLDNESPGRVGRWIGWQIVRSFVRQNPEINTEELLRMPTQKLFNL